MARILVVGDTPADRDLIGFLLGCTGHETVAAQDGAQALDLLETYHPDLIVSDMLMPVLDGMGLANRLRADPRFSGIPLLFHTATYGAEEAALLGRSCGVAQVFRKPWPPQDLVDAVHDRLGIPRVALEAQGPACRAEAGGEGPEPPAAVLRQDPRLDFRLQVAWIRTVCRELAEERDPAVILARFCGAARKITEASFALLCIPAEDGRGVRFFIPQGVALARPDSLPMQGTLLERLLRQGHSIRKDEPEEDPDLWGLPPGTPPFRYALAVPVASNNRAYGWIFLGGDGARTAFSEDDENLVSLLGSRAGMIYENLRLEALVHEQNLRRLQTEGLRRSLRDLVMGSEDAVISLDPDLRVTEWNRGAEALLGFRAEEAWGMPYDAVIPEEEKAGFADQVRGAMAGRIQPLDEGMRIRKDGARVPVARLFSVVRDDRGRLRGFTTILRDLTHRRALEVSLEETASRLQNLFNNLDEVVWSMDPASRRFLALSPACDKVLGHPPSAFISSPSLWLSVLHPEDAREAQAFLGHLGTGAMAAAEFRVLKPGRRPRWVQARGKGVQDGQGRTIRLDGLFLDITERREAEESLRRSEARFRSLVESMDDLVCTFDADLKLTGLYGRPARSLRARDYLGRGLWQLLPQAAAQSFSGLFSQVLAHHPGTIESTDLLEGRCLRVSAAPINLGAEAGPPGGIVAVAHDLTEFLRLKDRLVQQERFASLGTLVGSVAHDVRSPLQAVTAALELLEEDEGALPRSSLEALGLLRAGIEQINALMDDLLAYAKPQSLDRSAVAAGALVREAVDSLRLLSAQRGVRLQADLQDPDRSLWVDGPRLLQVLRNLLENALQHSPPGSQVDLRAGPDPAGDDGHWTLAVEDRGAGIRPEDFGRIFDPFFTRRKEGTGLGLAICQRIVAQHGGTLWAENRKEGGVRMTLRIPAGKAEEEGGTG